MVSLPENLQIARMLIQSIFPYWRQLLWALEPLDAPGLGTIGVDRHWRLYIDVAEVSKWPLEEGMLALMHEIVHITNRHLIRGGPEDNVAADLAANSWIEELIPTANYVMIGRKINKHLAMPGTWLHPTQYQLPVGLSLEDYRELLAKKQPKRQQPQQDGTSKNGQGGEGFGKPGVGNGKCGSCSHQGYAPWEKGAPQEGGPPGLSPQEIEVRIKQVAQATKDHASRMAGSMPGCISRWADRELRPPTIPWTRELASSARASLQLASGATYRSWRKLNRRSAGDLLFPGMRNPVPNLALVIDVSGSMSDKNIQDAISEGQGVIRELSNTPVPVLATDAAVHVCKKMCDMRRMPLVGGGGTDMRVGIAAAASLRPRPNVIVVFTDGYTGWGSGPVPGIKVIAVLVCPGPQPPEWIRTIRVNHEKDADS